VIFVSHRRAHQSLSTSLTHEFRRWLSPAKDGNGHPDREGRPKHKMLTKVGPHPFYPPFSLSANLLRLFPLTFLLCSLRAPCALLVRSVCTAAGDTQTSACSQGEEASTLDRLQLRRTKWRCRDETRC
jgi:hypothetical protein